MIRNLKAIGLAMFALLALGAIGAQGASAVEEHTFIHDGVSESAILTGTTEPGKKEKFTLTNAKVECEDVTYRGTAKTRKENHVTVYPIFGDKPCTSTAGAAVVTNNGCTYTFGSDTDHYPHYPAGETHATVSLACGHSGNITIAAGGCTITVSTTHSGGVIVNHNLPGIRYHEALNHSGGKTAITVTATVKTIKATTVGANCLLLGLGNPGTHVNGEYTGTATVTCYEDNEGSIKDPHTTVYTEGSLANCGLTTP